MVSPETLRRYPFFAGLTDSNLRDVAMLAEEREVDAGAELFNEGLPADTLYLLVEGGLDIHYVVSDEIDRRRRKDLFVTELNPGEPFGISALIEPHTYTSTVRATRRSRVVAIHGPGLRTLCGSDPHLCATLMKQAARTAMNRLYDTRVQLVAARP